MPLNINKYMKKKKRNYLDKIKLHYKLHQRRIRQNEKNQIIKKGINFKRGLRRIIITLITFIALISLCFSGIFDDYQFKDSIKVYNIEQPKNKISLSEFLNIYGFDVSLFDLKCFPYKQYCNCDKATFVEVIYNNSELIIENTENNKIKKQIKILMPSRFQYFTWQLFDFLLIPFCSLLAYLFYILLETVFIWIIKGFKSI